MGYGQCIFSVGDCCERYRFLHIFCQHSVAEFKALVVVSKKTTLPSSSSRLVYVAFRIITCVLLNYFIMYASP
jgi:hypothetical protein